MNKSPPGHGSKLRNPAQDTGHGPSRKDRPAPATVAPESPLALTRFETLPGTETGVVCDANGCRIPEQPAPKAAAAETHKRDR